MHNLALAGFIFGLGLLISGMADPAKVLNFLDLAGTFDPSLIFVMLGAVVVTFAGYRLVLRRPRPLLAERFFLPTLKEIDARVILGPAIFGIGWGLSGFCPGPAITRSRYWRRERSSSCRRCSLALVSRACSCNCGRQARGRSLLDPATPKAASAIQARHGY
jgi:hypothetical protein